MKKYMIFLIITAFLAGCAPKQTANRNGERPELRPEKNEEGEWELEVLDSQYDYFLNAIAKPRNMYSETLLRSRNLQLVSEWNSLYFAGRYPNVIESSIVYDPQENYGFEFNYRLYQVFAYVQWKYGLRLRGLSMTEVR